MSGSPGLFGMYTFFPPSKSTILLILIVLPLPTLKILFLSFFFLLTLITALTISETWVKSLFCFPFPTIVNGLFAIFCARNTPKTAP